MTDRKELIDRLRYAHEHSQQRVNGSDIFKEAADALEAEQCAVVKPLEWYDYEGGSVADQAFGAFYSITKLRDTWVCDGDLSGEFRSAEDAKSAAQADYERRILSALTIRPASEVAVEAKAEAIEAAKDIAAKWWERSNKLNDNDGAFGAEEIRLRIDASTPPPPAPLWNA